MVFSVSLTNKEMGSGYVLPHRYVTHTKSELEKEAKRMGSAEGPKVDLVANWVSVALLININSQYHSELRDSWKEIIGNRLISHPLLKPFNGDPSPISEDGFLTIPWPTTLDDTDLENYDYLLATTTLPMHKDERDGVHRYPTVKEIAYDVVCERDDDYFRNNLKNNITTFQDHEILTRLKK